MKHSKTIKICAAIACVGVLLLLIYLAAGRNGDKEQPEGTTPTVQTSEQTQPTDGTTPSVYNPDGTPPLPVGGTENKEFSIPGYTTLENAAVGEFAAGYEVVSVGRYTGAYMEDGSDDPVENVLAMLLHYTGGGIIELAELTADVDGNQAEFAVMGVPTDGYVLVLENNRMTVEESAKVAAPTLGIQANVYEAVVDYSGEFEVYLADGVINIRNITDHDYQQPVYVCYKNFANDVYMGGHAYRAGFNGVQAGSIAQSIQPHVSKSETVILYMVYAD